MIDETIGSYRIVDRIGQGGMGEVYRARDTKLNRDVAIKVLPDSLRGDAERIARLQREAEMLAALNHPNIAHVYGVEEAAGLKALVMELVEGPTLADRLAEGAMSVDETLPIARQVLEALEAAHDRGIVHRDLKPANIKVRPDGTVKVLDFGLAKAMEPAGASPPSTSHMPTITTPAMTQMGVILGTAAYMSPEQAKGRPLDRRTDIWAFGCVLYEMLTGTRAFAGEDVSDTLANVLKVDASLEELPSSVPPRVQQVVRACLQKNPRQRLDSAQDVRLALDGAFETASKVADVAVTTPPSWRRAMPYVAAALLSGLAVGVALWALRPAGEPAIVSRFGYDLPEGQSFRNPGRNIMALSPDGRSFVYNAVGGLYLRSMDDLAARRIPGTEESLGTPFFSPDGQQVGYHQDGQLKRISIGGGAPVVIASGVERTAPGIDWTEDGSILFGDGQGISRVPATGGSPERVIAAQPGEFILGPQLLPDGDTVLFTAAAGGDSSNIRIAAQSLRTGKRTVVVEGGLLARYLPTGHLVYVFEGTLFGIAFDPDRLAVKGGPVPLVEGIWFGWNWGVSTQGTLAYVAQTAGAALKPVWVSRDGAAQAIETVPGGTTPRISPDGRKALLEVDRDLWIYELATGRRTRLTSDGRSVRGAWDPNGTQVAYSSGRGEGQQVWIAPADGSGEPRQVTKVDRSAHVDSWSPDGRVLAFHRHKPGANTQLFTVSPAEPDREPVGLLEREFSAEGTVFSPDGRYVAYISFQSGISEVYIRPFPGPGAQVTVSVGGGQQPVWAANGELFYRDLTGERMMVVAVKTQPTLEVGVPRQLFQGRFFNALGSPRPQYDVTADGQRLLMLQPEGAAQSRIVVVQNWFEELKKLVPVQ